MADIRIPQGDSDTITDTISNLSSLDGYTGKMYIYTEAGVLYDTVTASISGLVCDYEFLNDTTKAYEVANYVFETKIFDSADHVYTPSEGRFVIEQARNNDPS